MKVMPRGKRGGFTDLFIFMIVAFVIVTISVAWIFMGNKVNDKLHETMDDMDLHDTEGNNASQVINNSMGDGGFNGSIQALHWITIFLIAGMILSIFIGSYLVTTKPIFFIPYLFIVIIAIIVSVPMANSYERLMSDAILSPSFAGFTGANWIMLNLPIWITIIGITGGIIMFSRMGKREEYRYY